MNSKNVLKEEVDQIISQANWGRAGISLNESAQENQVTEADVAQEEVESEEQIAESEEHACPLCESKLEAPISDDQLTEHINMMLEIINEMNDISDEELEAIEEELDNELGEEESDEISEAYGKKGKMGFKFMKKPKPAPAPTKAKTPTEDD